MAQNITIAGATFNAVPSIMVPTAGGGQAIFADPSDTTATAADVAQGKTFLTALGAYATGTASGGGGASNIVTGTFKGTTAESAMDITLDYSGNGYPVAVIVYPTEGAYNSGGDFYKLVQRYATVLYFLVKSYSMTAPGYDGAGNDDMGYIVKRYKNSTTSSTAAGTSYSPNDKTAYNNIKASAGDFSALKIRSAKKLSVFITSTQSGFATNYEYTYHVIYSE